MFEVGYNQITGAMVSSHNAGQLQYCDAIHLQSTVLLFFIFVQDYAI